MKMLVMIRGVTTINNDIADCARASTVAQDRQALDTDIGALQTAEQVVAHVSGDDLTALKTPGQAPTIEERAVGRNSDEHGRATVRSDADARGSLRSPSRHHSLPVAAHGVADSLPDNL